MVELKSFPFDSISDDREYSAQIFRNYFHKFLSTGIYFGKYKNYGDYSMKVVPSLELNVRVTKGAGIIKGLDFELEEDIILPISLSLGKIRKDMVVVRADDTLPERKTTLYIKEGDNIDFAELERTTDVYEICLAKITVGDTKVTIDLADIEDTRRDSNLAGIVTSLIDIDIQDVLDDITAEKDAYFEELEITTHEQAQEFIERLQEMLEQMEKDMLPAELVTVNNANYEGTNLNSVLTEIVSKINTAKNQTMNYAAQNTQVTLNSSNWVFNSTTGYYEYTITDNNITTNHLVEGYPDISNQKKIGENYIQSYNGGYKIIVSKEPEENITMDVKIQLMKGAD